MILAQIKNYIKSYFMRGWIYGKKAGYFPGIKFSWTSFFKVLFTLTKLKVDLDAIVKTRK